MLTLKLAALAVEWRGEQRRCLKRLEDGISLSGQERTMLLSGKQSRLDTVDFHIIKAISVPSILVPCCQLPRYQSSIKHKKDLQASSFIHSYRTVVQSTRFLPRSSKTFISPTFHPSHNGHTISFTMHADVHPAHLQASHHHLSAQSLLPFGSLLRSPNHRSSHKYLLYS